MPDWLNLVTFLGICFLSGIPHEIAHATVASRCGDSTAERAGRLSWDPRVHFDPFWTFLLPALLLVTSGGRFVFGGPKPVPVVPWYLRNPKRDLMLVSLAGPITNLAICAGFTLLAWVPGFMAEGSANHYLFLRIVWINLLLFCFNILPIPPLDGFGVLQGFFPRAWEGAADALRAGGIMILVIAMMTGLVHRLMSPLLALFMGIIVEIQPLLHPKYM